MKYLMACMVVLLSLSSCSTSDDTGEITGQEVELAFSLNVTQSASSVVSVRSSSYTDSSIYCIDLLVFDENDLFLQRIKVNGIETTGDSRTFTVRLPASSVSRTIHVITNGRDETNTDVVNFGDISSGMTEDDVALTLKTGSLSAYTSLELPLVMWGRTELSSIVPGTETSVINLIRGVVAMRVECAAATSANGIDKFLLESFSLQQSAALGKVIPDNRALSNGVPTSVSVFSETQYIDYVNPDGSGIWYTATANVTTEAYLYERNNVLDNTGLSVIVHGKYDGTDGYYKIWLKNSVGGAVHPVRNHRYLIRIAKVSGLGYPTLQEALNADYSANILTEVVDNNDDITDIIADGKYELGVSSNSISLIGDGVKTLGVVLKTNPTANLTATTDADWITNLTFSASGDNRYTLTGTLAPTDSTCSGTVIVKAGNLVRTITVEQLPD